MQKEQSHRVRRVAIDAEDAGQRIDNFLLRELRGVPRSRVYRLVRRGEVRVNGGRIRADYRLVAGDEVRIPPVRTGAAAPVPAAPAALLRRLEAAIVYEDRRLLVLDKPAGLAAHGGSGVSLGAIEALRLLRPPPTRLELVHRLDRDTSGCMMLAKRRSALRTLHAMLREGQVTKRYLALLGGSLAGDRHDCVAPLLVGRRGGERVVTVSGDGKPARTVFSVIQRFAAATLCEVETFTGRTHQIRVHAAHLGHALAGDEKYGGVAQQWQAAGLDRLFLHAHAIAFTWPDDGEQFVVGAPLPGELRGVLDRLEGPR